MAEMTDDSPPLPLLPRFSLRAVLMLMIALAIAAAIASPWIRMLPAERQAYLLIIVLVAVGTLPLSFVLTDWWTRRRGRASGELRVQLTPSEPVAPNFDRSMPTLDLIATHFLALFLVFQTILRNCFLGLGDLSQLLGGLVNIVVLMPMFLVYSGIFQRYSRIEIRENGVLVVEPGHRPVTLHWSQTKVSVHPECLQFQHKTTLNRYQANCNTEDRPPLLAFLAERDVAITHYESRSAQ